MSVPPAHPHPERRIAFDLPAGIVPGDVLTVAGAGPLLADLRHALIGWDWRPARARDPEPAISVRRGWRETRVFAPAFPAEGIGAADPLYAANALAGALTAEISRLAPEWVQLHAAAAVAGDGSLDFFLGPTKAGKSTLAFALAMAGRRLVGDDRLAVRADGTGATGLGLAVACKLRLPMPTDWGPEAAAWLRARATARRADLAFTRLSPAELAPLGTRAPVGRLFVLERREEGAARLEPLGRAAAVRALLEGVIAPNGPAGDTLSWAQTVAAAPAWRLTYARAGEAVRLLERVPAAEAARRENKAGAAA